MARIVITSWGSYGDVNPYVGIALALRARGHTPVLAIPAYYRAAVEREGLEHAAVGPDVEPSDASVVGRIMDARRGTEFLLRELLAPAIDRTYEALRAAATGAELLVTHPVTFAGPVLAEATGIPWVSTVLAPASFMSERDPFVMPPAPWLKQVERVSRWPTVWLMRVAHRMTRPWLAPVDALRARLGLPRGRHPVFEGQHSPTLVLALFSEVLGRPQPDWPPNTRVTGFPFYDRRDRAGKHNSVAPELADFLDAGEPPIIFTLGSSAFWAAEDFYTESVAAARAVGRRALLLIGDERNRPAAPLPEGVAAFEYAPFGEVLPRAAAVVHQGGVGTTGQALRAGRPALVVPFSHDQFDNGNRVARAGCGLMLPRAQYNAARAARALREMSEHESYATNAAEAARVIESEDGANTACDALEEVLRTED